MIKERTKREYQKNQITTKEKERKEKSLHGQYTKIADKTDKKNTYKWMRNGYIKKETEGLITAAQDQRLPTSWRKVNIEKQPGTPLCRMCNEGDETSVSHSM